MKNIVFICISAVMLFGATLENCANVDIKAKRIYGASPATNFLLYSFDPSLMTGLNFKLWEYEEEHMSEIKDLPVVGGWFGQGSNSNFEIIAKLNPDLIIFWNHRKQYERVVGFLEKLAVPTCYMDLDTLDDYPKAYRALGRISGNTKRAEVLANDFQSRLDRLRPLAKQKKNEKQIKLYYAEGVDGLSTECHNSLHTEILEESGAYNVYRCAKNAPYGTKKITPEKLLVFDPDIVLIHKPSFFRTIDSSPHFKNLRAFKEGSFHMIPRIPFNWIDRPNSFIRVLGLEWLMDKLYPELELNIVEETKKFYKLYFRKELSNEDVARIFKRSGEMREQFKKKKRKKD